MRLLVATSTPPPSELSGFVVEGYPPRTQIHLDKQEPEVSSLEGDEKLDEISCCAAAVSKQTPHAEIGLVNQKDKFSTLSLIRAQI